jgi:hypothetical protein
MNSSRARRTGADTSARCRPGGSGSGSGAACAGRGGRGLCRPLRCHIASEIRVRVDHVDAVGGQIEPHVLAGPVVLGELPQIVGGEVAAVLLLDEGDVAVQVDIERLDRRRAS